MVDNKKFVVSKEIALRTGMFEYKYRTADGRYVIDERTLNRVRLTPDELMHGIQGIEEVTDQEAQTLIAEGGFLTGDKEAENAQKEATESQEQEDVVESTNEEENVPQEEETEVKTKSTKKK